MGFRVDNQPPVQPVEGTQTSEVAEDLSRVAGEAEVQAGELPEAPRTEESGASTSAEETQTNSSEADEAESVDLDTLKQDDAGRAAQLEADKAAAADPLKELQAQLERDIDNPTREELLKQAESKDPAQAQKARNQLAFLDQQKIVKPAETVVTKLEAEERKDEFEQKQDNCKQERNKDAESAKIYRDLMNKTADRYVRAAKQPKTPSATKQFLLEQAKKMRTGELNQRLTSQSAKHDAKAKCMQMGQAKAQYDKLVQHRKDPKAKLPEGQQEGEFKIAHDGKGLMKSGKPAAKMATAAQPKESKAEAVKTQVAQKAKEGEKGQKLAKSEEKAATEKEAAATEKPAPATVTKDAATGIVAKYVAHETLRDNVEKNKAKEKQGKNLGKVRSDHAAAEQALADAAVESIRQGAERLCQQTEDELLDTAQLCFQSLNEGRLVARVQIGAGASKQTAKNEGAIEAAKILAAKPGDEQFTKNQAKLSDIRQEVKPFQSDLEGAALLARFGSAHWLRPMARQQGKQGVTLARDYRARDLGSV